MSNPYRWLPADSQKEMEMRDRKETSGNIFVDHLTGITHTKGAPKETPEYCHRCFILNVGNRAVCTVNGIGYCKDCLELLT